MPKKKQNVPYTEEYRKEAVRRSEEEGICTGFEIRNNFISSGAISRFIK